MSDGRQLREYAHVDDVALSIVALLVRDWTGPVAIDLSTGEPVMLHEASRAVFGAFRRDELLQTWRAADPAGGKLRRLLLTVACLAAWTAAPSN